MDESQNKLSLQGVTTTLEGYYYVLDMLDTNVKVDGQTMTLSQLLILSEERKEYQGLAKAYLQLFLAQRKGLKPLIGITLTYPSGDLIEV